MAANALTSNLTFFAYAVRVQSSCSTAGALGVLQIACRRSGALTNGVKLSSPQLPQES